MLSEAQCRELSQSRHANDSFCVKAKVVRRVGRSEQPFMVHVVLLVLYPRSDALAHVRMMLLRISS
jgi:hypothetical protein